MEVERLVFFPVRCKCASQFLLGLSSNMRPFVANDKLKLLATKDPMLKDKKCYGSYCFCCWHLNVIPSCQHG